MELSILENLNFHARLHGLNVQKLKQKIYNELKTNKLNNKTKNKVRTLSGGERRKVELIRALLHNPKVLLFNLFSFNSLYISCFKFCTFRPCNLA